MALLLTGCPRLICNRDPALSTEGRYRVTIVEVYAGLPAARAGIQAGDVITEVEGKLTQGMAHLGLPESMVTPLAVLELSCVVIYLVPATSVLGAILLAGYVGGTICTAWRVGDPSFLQIGLGIIVWLGLYLREPRLRALIPIRTAATTS